MLSNSQIQNGAISISTPKLIEIVKLQEIPLKVSLCITVAMEGTFIKINKPDGFYS